MTQYSYRATDATGTEKTGTIAAISLQTAKEQLLALQLEPIEIYELAPNTPPVPTQMQPTGIIGKEIEKSQMQTNTPAVYFPLYETLRLYAGWLLYQFIKELPIHIPYAESLFLSPLVLSFTFGAYLFLLLSGIYKQTGKKKLTGLGLGILGIAVFLLYRMNVA